MDDPAIPKNGVTSLVNSAFGQPVASSDHPSDFLCDQVTSYQFWLKQVFPESTWLDPYRALDGWGFGADPDGDGLLNLAEYGHALDPTTPDFISPISAQITNFNGASRLKIICRRRANEPNIIFNWFASTDLIHWQPADANLSLIGSTPIDSTTEESAYVETSAMSSTFGIGRSDMGKICTERSTTRVVAALL